MNSESVGDAAKDIFPPTRTIPLFMRTNSGKRIINKNPNPQTTKRLRMKSLLWVKPSVEPRALASNFIIQLFPVLIINIAAISTGISYYFNYLPPQHRYYTEVLPENSNWIAWSFTIGSVLGCLLSGLLGQHFGQRKCMLILSLPDIIGWILTALSQNFICLLCGRFLNGVAAAGYVPMIQGYVTEISQNHLRGLLSALTFVGIALGSVLAYGLSHWLQAPWFAAIATTLPLIMIPGLLYIPDSPYWHLNAGHDKKALSAMSKLRHKNANVIPDMMFLNARGTQNSMEDPTKCLFQRQNRKPFLLLVFLFMIITLSGSSAGSHYGLHQYVYQARQPWIILGIAQLLGSIALIPMIKYLPRRFLLCFSAIAMGLALIVLGFDSKDNPDLSFGHKAALAIFSFAEPIGLSSIPFLLVAELFPNRFRILMSGITLGVARFFSIVITSVIYLLFPTGLDEPELFWVYSTGCLVVVIVALLLIPETRNKKMEDIEEIFRHKESLHVTPLQTPATKKKSGIPYPHPSLQFTL